MTELLTDTTRRTVGVRDIPLVMLAPRRLYRRVEDVPAWGWPLVVLLTLVTLIGYATVQTGLIDRQVESSVRARIAQIDRTQRDVVERSALREMYAQEYKKGAFEQLLTRIRVIVAEPAKALASALLIAAVLYGVVAVGGRKPEWHTLLTICVFAGFIDALRLLVALGLVLGYGTLAVDTSLVPFARLLAAGPDANPVALAACVGLLSALDPFRIWFWLVVVVGLSVTAQLRGWRAWTICILGWLAAAGWRTAFLAASTASAVRAAAQG